MDFIFNFSWLLEKAYWKQNKNVEFIKTGLLFRRNKIETAGIKMTIKNI